MAEDIVPGLLDVIESEFDNQTINSAALKKALQKLESKTASYSDVNDFAIAIGEILAEIFGKHITADNLPDGRMYYNIAERLLNPTMAKNHELISEFANQVQTELNHQAGIRIRAQTSELNQDKIDGIINRVSSESNFDDIKWILNEPIVNFSQSVVDDTIKANADFHAKSGLQPKITRTVSGHKPCDWCKNLAGSYNYFDAPDDIYRRHDRCRCIVEYNPGDGKRQNVWSKTWKDPQKNDKIEARKQIGLSDVFSSFASGAKHYNRDDSNDYIRSPEQIRREKYAYTRYETFKNSNQDIEKRKIYSNIGKFRDMKDFSMEDVNIAFNHVFNDLHDLEHGTSLFAPDYDMAQSWSRLITGENIKEHDLILLRHERLEHDYMYNDGLDYLEAHYKTSEQFDYSKAFEKFKDKGE